jgi:hypothetical protein
MWKAFSIKLYNYYLGLEQLVLTRRRHVSNRKYGKWDILCSLDLENDKYGSMPDATIDSIIFKQLERINKLYLSVKYVTLIR